MHRMLRSAWTWAVLVPTAWALVACSSTPRSPSRTPTPAAGRDGPGANPPPNLAQVPDAEPRVEPLRNGGPNRAYEVFGRWYTPLAGDARAQRTRPGLVVRPQVPRPAHVERRTVRHVRDDGGAQDHADPELCARAQPGQRPRGDRAHQRPRPVPRRARDRPELHRGAEARRAQCRGAGGSGAPHARRHPHRRMESKTARARSPPHRLRHGCPLYPHRPRSRAWCRRA